MKKKILRYLKHLLITVLAIITTLITIGYFMGASVHYGDNPMAMNWHNEGPYVFFEQDSLMSVNYVRGNKEEGFYVDQKLYPIDSAVAGNCHFALDSTSFDFNIEAKFRTPSSSYEDDHKILAYFGY